MKLAELAGKIGAELVGDGTIEVSAVNTLEDARPGELSFLANPKYARQLETTQASAVIVGMAAKSDRVALLKAKDPYYAHMQAVVLLHGHRRHPFAGVHPKAHVEPSAAVGEGSVIYPGVYVGPGARIGKDCILYANAVVYDGCVLGDRVIVHAGAVIGQDGYGFSTHGGEHHKIPQIGNVVIEDDVEVGANTCIARAAIGSTVIGRGTKIDSQVMVGHGAKVGPHGLLVAQVGIAGSTEIGHHVSIGGQAGLAGHLKVGDNVMIAAQTGVIADVEDKAILAGMPAMPFAQSRRVYANFMQLPDLAQRIKDLEKKLADMSKSDND